MATSPLESISKDLDWREAELGSLKLLLARKDISEHQKIVLLRACWALLYAHYEGFVKTALTIFYDEARKRTQECGSLPTLTRLFALETMLKKIRNLPPPEFLGEIETFSGTYHRDKPDFPDVDTKSNLWPNILRELLDTADLTLPSLAVHHVLIKTLVTRRNKIAHGNQEMITEVAYYRNYEAAVYELMYELSFSIDERLNQSPYV